MLCGCKSRRVRDTYISHIFTVLKPLCAGDLPLSALQVAKIICSLPFLEDLRAFCVEDIRPFGVERWDKDEDGLTFQPPTSPPLTGMLHLRLTNGIESIARRLLDLPNGIRFRKIGCAWRRLEDLQWITALVEGCAESLERVDIECDTWRKFPRFTPGASTDLIHVGVSWREGCFY